jgi:hypothetical protein
MVVSRTVTRIPLHGGKACPSLSQHRKCNEHDCPRDCQVTAWTIFSGCSAVCKGGTKTRTRSITHEASLGGKPCPVLKNTRDCNTEPCAVDCTVSEWGTWSMCTASCGKGVHWRERTITQIKKWDGHKCLPLKDMGECKERECPIDCKMGEWGEFSACDASCGGGVQKRTRKPLVNPNHGGHLCPHDEESKHCNQQGCPLDCTYTAYGEWSACSESCGYGLRSRSRTVSTRPEFGGKACPGVRQTAECNMGLCPIHCSVSSWSPWGHCTKTCGEGQQSRTRVVVRHAHHGGYVCPDLAQTQLCNMRPCPVHCEMNEWTNWSRCSKECDYGVQTRSRTIKSPLSGPAYGGKACPAMWEEKACASWKCAVNCEVSNWGSPGPCSKSCGSGTYTRTRSILTIPQWKGHVCPALEEQLTCNAKPCKVNCQYFDFQDWSQSPCSVSCGTGVQRRTKTVRVAPLYGGTPCIGLHETKTCDKGPCPVHCEVTDWEKWTDCDATCGVGHQERIRRVTQDHNDSGDICPNLKEKRECFVKACPVNCVANPVWRPWGSCTQTCDGGTRTRTRDLLSNARNGGVCEEALSEKEDCGLDACPVDCQLGDWGVWGECSVTCLTGIKNRTKTIISEAVGTGRSCSSIQQIEKVHCNAGPCPVKCEVSEWGSWDTCSESCGVGKTSRTRSVVTTALHGGVCPNLKQGKECMLKLCPVDCEVSEFSGWSTCSVSCGTGLQTRSKRVTTGNVGAGKACPAKADMVQVTDCTRPACVTTTTTTKAATIEAPTPAPTFSTEAAWDQVDHSRTKHGDWAPTNGKSATRAEGVWEEQEKHVHVAADINDRHGHCRNGDELVPDGWKGAGATAQTYCNLCTCVPGEEDVTCTKRNCPAVRDPQVKKNQASKDWATCDTVTCTATQRGPIEAPHWVIEVQHSHSEHMKKHVCTFNKFSGRCTCKCKAPYKTYTQSPQYGAFNFGSVTTSKCKTIHFKNPYDPNLGDVRVSASASFSAAADAANDASHVWVQSTSHDRFTLCARSPFADRQYYKKASTTFIGQYYAFQGDLTNSQGNAWASHGAPVVESLATSKTPCQTISFGKSYDHAPMVIGTVDFNGNSIQQQLTSWVENVNAEQFRVCFHNEGQLAAETSAKPRYNWIAFEHANPSIWFAEEKPYSMGGRVAAGAWSEYAGSRKYASKFAGMAIWNACQTVEFGKTFASAPTVLVTANHEDSTSLDWSNGPHPETQTWVDAVSTSSFKVCAMERAPISGDRDNSLKWDWIVFGEDSIAVAA